MFVVPEIEPAMVRLPADVVTVQSPVCALGLLSTQLTTSIVAVICESVMVVESDDTELLLTFTTPTAFERFATETLLEFPSEVTALIKSPCAIELMTERADSFILIN